MWNSLQFRLNFVLSPSNWTFLLGSVGEGFTESSNLCITGVNTARRFSLLLAPALNSGQRKTEAWGLRWVKRHRGLRRNQWDSLDLPPTSTKKCIMNSGKKTAHAHTHTHTHTHTHNPVTNISANVHLKFYVIATSIFPSFRVQETFAFCFRSTFVTPFKCESTPTPPAPKYYHRREKGKINHLMWNRE